MNLFFCTKLSFTHLKFIINSIQFFLPLRTCYLILIIVLYSSIILYQAIILKTSHSSFNTKKIKKYISNTSWYFSVNCNQQNKIIIKTYLQPSSSLIVFMTAGCLRTGNNICITSLINDNFQNWSNIMRTILYLIYTDR